MQYLELSENYFSAVVALANSIHGDNYLSLAQLQLMQLQGVKQGINASFIAVDRARVVGYRLSFSPEQWQIDHWCSEGSWPVAVKQMAYFKSVGVVASYRGKGVAKNLLRLSIQALQQQGATAGLAHIWRESPGNTAQLYFTKAGAKLINIHPERWRHLSETLGYNCPRCGQTCLCSAAEMALLFAEL